MKGDDNEFSGALDDTVGGDVWKPALQLGGWGTAVLRVGTPAAAMSLLAGSAGLRGLAMFVPAPARARAPRRAADGVIA